MSQNFGPVSSERGERRFNVLFTRPKKRCRVFSSIRHSEIRVTAAKHVGTRVLKRYLKCAETGELDIPVLTGAEMDSPFEEAVARALQSQGFRVAAQVGSSGFKIDLPVCDGARYHSSSWARERDRLRQAVLEQKAWRFHRIWSTDWFYSRDTEMAKLLEAIERARLDSHPEMRSEPPAPRPEVERAEPVEAKEPGRTPYVEADFKVVGFQHIELHEASEADLARCGARIVETEGPVHIDEVAKRLSRLWGYQRTGSRINAAVKSAADRAERRNTIQYVDGAARQFLDLRDRTEKAGVRDRSGVRSSTLRKFEMLPPMEIRQGILAAVERNIGINAADCAREVSRMLGFKSLGADLRECVAGVATEMVAEGGSRQLGDELRLPEAQNDSSPS